MLSNELRDQQEGKATRWAVFCYSADSCSVSERVFIPDCTHFLASELVESGEGRKSASRSGLMGALADSVLAAGGDVTGVEPEFFVKGELQHDGLTELIVTKDMTERKTKMIELGDAFIAFPGGTGTLEEIAEVMSKVSLKHLDAPCILYDLDGYYTGLRMLLSHMIETGLSSEERQKGIYFAKDLAEIKTILNR